MERIIMLIQWFPGHMAKTKRLIIEHLKAVDVAAGLLECRISSGCPYSSVQCESYGGRASIGEAAHRHTE